MGPNNEYESCWGDCNGSGSETMDYWEHLDEETATSDEFHKQAAAPWLSSSNQKETEPAGHPMGFTNAQKNRPSFVQKHGVPVLVNPVLMDPTGAETEALEVEDHATGAMKVGADEGISVVKHHPKHNQVLAQQQAQFAPYGLGNGEGSEKWD